MVGNNIPVSHVQPEQLSSCFLGAIQLPVYSDLSNHDRVVLTIILSTSGTGGIEKI